MNVSIDMAKYFKHYERKDAVFIRIYKNLRKDIHTHTLYVYVHVCVYIYIHICVCVCV